MADHPNMDTPHKLAKYDEKDYYVPYSDAYAGVKDSVSHSWPRARGRSSM